MAKFSKAQAQQQIEQHFVKAKVRPDLATSLSFKGADHYCDVANATMESSIAYARTFLKSLMHVKDAPTLKRGGKRK